MTIESLARTAAVTPVVDYEPPPQAVPPQASLPARPRPRPVPDRPAGDRRARPSAALRAAAAFADAALRQVLEVIDRRRPAAHLRVLLSAGLADSVRSMGPTTAGGVARLRRLRLQVVGPGEPPGAIEVSGTYTRGRRTHAVACRIEPVRTSGQPRWQVVALHIG